MSKIEQLIKKFCPKGVEWVSLGAIATDFFRGNGILRTQVTEEGTPCVRYGEIYTAYGLSFSKCVSHTNLSYLKSPKYIHTGDIVFAITGEKVEEIGKSTVYVGNEPCLAGGDTAVMRHKQNGRYLAYALATNDAQRQKSRGKKKSKVVHASIPDLKKVKIPIPPLPVQDEIANALDAMDAVVKALEEERNARFEQFEAMRDKLLKFANGGGYCKITIAELGGFYAGLAGKTKKDFGVGEGRFLTYMDIFSNFAAPARPSGVVDIGIGEKQSMVKKGDVIFTGSSETKDEAGMTCVVEKDYDQPVYLNSFCFGLRVKNVEGVCVEFMKYFFRSTVVRGLIAKTANGVTRFNISKDALRKVQICVPEIEEQRRIAKTLDSFASILIALDEEIAARREQFAGWLEKLMEFKEAA